MTWGEQVLWAKRVLEEPEPAREALDSVKDFREEFEKLYVERMPYSETAKRFYKDMLANMLIDFAVEKRGN